MPTLTVLIWLSGCLLPCTGDSDFLLVLSSEPCAYISDYTNTFGFEIGKEGRGYWYHVDFLKTFQFLTI